MVHLKPATHTARDTQTQGFWRGMRIMILQAESIRRLHFTRNHFHFFFGGGRVLLFIERERQEFLKV